MINLAALPPLTSYRSVTARAINIDARTALRVELEDTVATSGRPGIDYIDMPTFVVLPMAFAEGTISVDIRSRLNASAPDFARAFAGIAYRISEDCKRFECVYIRPMNGLKANPPPPRDKRAVQYFAFPDWKFDRLRDEYPDGRYEAGADVGPDEWTNLLVKVGASRFSAWVNGILVLDEIPAIGPAEAGAIGLWVDIGTEALFSNLEVTPRQVVYLGGDRNFRPALASPGHDHRDPRQTWSTPCHARPDRMLRHHRRRALGHARREP